MKKLLIVDDHPVVREGLKRVFEDENRCRVYEAESGHQALELIKADYFDLVLLDISMPHMNGLEALKRIKAIKPEIPVLMLSIFKEKHYAVRSFKSGAQGYISKNCTVDELTGAVGKVLAGGRYITESVAEEMASNLNSGNNEMPHNLLSHRELQVMLMIASGRTANDIAGHLDISVKTVSTYRSRLLKKMKMLNNAEITYYAVRHGLLE